MKKFDIASVDDDSLRDMFEAAFAAKANDKKNNDLNIEEGSFECAIEREGQTGSLKVNLTVFGLAGTTTRPQFHDRKTGKVIRGGKTVVVEVPNKGSARFVFENALDLNTNDYVVTYRLEDSNG